MTPLTIVTDRLGDAGLLLAYLAVLLLVLIALVPVVNGASRLVSAFFGGVRAARRDEPVTGYSDPGTRGRMRW